MICQPKLDIPASKRCRVKSWSNERRVTANRLESGADDISRYKR
jgi:hypothetical protein